MANYRLPGVYSSEIARLSVNAAAGGNSVLAIVGPALGYSMASQQGVISETEPIALNNLGVIEGGVSMRSRTTQTVYENGVDFVEMVDIDTGATSVKRRLRTLSLNKSSVIGRSKTFYTVEPDFSIMVDALGNDIDGYPICGTVQIVDTMHIEYTEPDVETGEATTEVVDYDCVEGVDFAIDYKTGMFSALAGGIFDETANGHALLISFEWTTAEPVVLVGESANAFEHNYISRNGLGEKSIRLVSCAYDEYDWGSTPGSEEGYVEGVDFVIDYQTGRIQRTPNSRIPSFEPVLQNYLYAEFAYDLVRDGEQVLIEYAYKGSNYSEAIVVSSYSEAASVYGSAWDSATGDIVSPLSLAAYIAFQNGASAIYLAAVDRGVTVERVTREDGTVEVVFDVAAPTNTAWEAAFDMLSMIEGIDIIVPVSGEEAVWQYGRAHLVLMKENADERVMFCGVDGTDGSGIRTATQLINSAKFLGSNDIWFVGPSTVRFRNPIRNTIDVIAGYYMAVAAAAYNSSVPQYTPLTRKVISGFYSANEYMTKVVKTNCCSNGVMYVDEVNGQLRILHGTSTDVSSIIKRETNITLTKYYVIKMFRQTFDNGYIGEIITDETVLDVTSTAFSLLSDLVESSYIASYSDLNVEVDSQIPTQVNVSFIYRPTFAMNYIQISFAIDTTAGTIVENELY